MALRIGLFPNSMFTCGNDGTSRNLCVLLGGSTQVVQQDNTNTNTNTTTAMMGLTFKTFSQTSIQVHATAADSSSSSTPTLYLIDNIWMDFDANSILEVSSHSKIEIIIHTGEIMYGTIRYNSMFSNVGNFLNITDMTIHNMNAKEFLITSSEGISILEHLKFFQSSFGNVTSVREGSIQIMDNSFLSDMTITETIFSITDSNSILDLFQIRVHNTNTTTTTAMTRRDHGDDNNNNDNNNNEEEEESSGSRSSSSIRTNNNWVTALGGSTVIISRSNFTYNEGFHFGFQSQGDGTNISLSSIELIGNKGDGSSTSNNNNNNNNNNLNNNIAVDDNNNNNIRSNSLSSLTSSSSALLYAVNNGMISGVGINFESNTNFPGGHLHAIRGGSWHISRSCILSGGDSDDLTSMLAFVAQSSSSTASKIFIDPSVRSRICPNNSIRSSNSGSDGSSIILGGRLVVEYPNSRCFLDDDDDDDETTTTRLTNSNSNSNSNQCLTDCVPLADENIKECAQTSYLPTASPTTTSFSSMVETTNPIPVLENINIRAVQCPNDPSVVGYTQISDINADQQAALYIMKLNGITTPMMLSSATNFTFRLCPHTVYDTSSIPLMIVLSKSSFLCGKDGLSSNGCILHGGPVQVQISNETVNGHLFSHASLMGLSFTNFTETSVSAISLSGPVQLTLQDVVWENFETAYIIQQQSSFEFSMLITIKTASIQNGVSKTNIFSFHNGFITMTDLNVRNLTALTFLDTNTFGITELRQSNFSWSRFGNVISTSAGSIQSVENVVFSDMNISENIFLVTDFGSSLSLVGVDVTNNYVQGVTMGEAATWVQATQESVVEVINSTFTGNGGTGFGFMSEGQETTIVLSLVEVAENRGILPTSSLLYAVNSGTIKGVNILFSDNTAFWGGHLRAATGGSWQLNHSCIVSGGVDDSKNNIDDMKDKGGFGGVAFVSQSSSYSFSNVFVDPSVTSLLCPSGDPNNGRLVMEAVDPTSSCFVGTKFCNTSCAPLSDVTECTLATAKFTSSTPRTMTTTTTIAQLPMAILFILTTFFLYS